MVIVLVGIFSTYTNYWWLEETNPRVRQRQKGGSGSFLGGLGSFRGSFGGSGGSSSTPKAAWAALKHGASNLSALLGRASRYSRLSSDGEF